MSKERLLAIRSALVAKGWTILNDPSSLFKVEDESITWAIVDASKKRLELRFQIFGHLGNRSSKLSDILYCVVNGSDIKLYFSKIRSLTWKRELPEFVAKLPFINPK